jgi:hypothetical protein
VKWWISLISIAVVAGCAEGRPAEDDSLAQPVRVQTGAVSDSRVTFTIAGGFARPSAVQMSVARPLVTLHTTGARAELDGLELPLGDVTVPASALPPHGLVLRNLALKAGPAHAEVLHAQADALELRATLPLELDWQLQLDDGSLYTLGPAYTEPVEVDVDVVRAGGAITATVQASCRGTCWSVDGVATLSDGAVYLETAAEVTVTP